MKAATTEKTNRIAYAAVPSGWLAHQIRAVHTQLGGTADLSLSQTCTFWPEWHQYRETIYRIADGITAGDNTCKEIAVRYLILNYFGSYSGYLRELLARRLKHAALTEAQQVRLHQHFSALLLSGAQQRELKECAKLWRLLATADQLLSLAADVCNARPEIRQRFTRIFPEVV